MRSSAVIAFLALLATKPVLTTHDNWKSHQDFNRAATVTLTRDVAIIGGGTTGSFSASLLKDRGYTFVVVEKRGNLGGHSQTYIDPFTGHAIEYGNVFFEDTETMRGYLNRYHVPFERTTPFNDSSHAIKFYNLRTGKHTSFEPPDPVVVQAAIDRWILILADNFPFLEKGYYIPDPVPSDLLLPFIDFIKKYDLDAMLNVAFQIAQGFGDFLHAPTLYAAKILSRSLLQNFKHQSMLVTPNNGELYKRAEAEFTAEESLLLSSKVVHIDRDPDHDGYISVYTKHHDYGAVPSITRIRARRLLVTIPPPSALGSGFSLKERERALFSKFDCNYYWSGVLRNAQLPSLEIQNCEPNNPGGVPKLPGVYVFEATASPDIHTFWYGAASGTANLTESHVKVEIISAIEKIRIASSTGRQNLDAAGKGIEFLAMGNFNPFACMVDAAEIGSGFYRHLYDLQGYRNTWWTGAAWHTHDASLLLDFTQGVIIDLARSFVDFSSEQKSWEEL